MIYVYLAILAVAVVGWGYALFPPTMRARREPTPTRGD